jgi:hypothetical protein
LPKNYAEFRELRKREVRLSPDPMGQDFSGSCTVTSRNPLIQIGATNGTKSERFDAKGVPSCCSGVLGDALEGPFATVKFGEFYFFYALR